METVGPTTRRECYQGFSRCPNRKSTPPSSHSKPKDLFYGAVFIQAFRKSNGATVVCSRASIAWTLNRLRAEIQPVSLENYQRDVLLAWQRADAEHRAEGVAGVETVLDLFDGMELAAAAWEPEVLALRVKDYSPQWLDQLCLKGKVGWGRLSPPQTPNARALNPLPSTPISVFDRENLPTWVELSNNQLPTDLTPDTHNQSLTHCPVRERCFSRNCFAKRSFCHRASRRLSANWPRKGAQRRTVLKVCARS